MPVLDTCGGWRVLGGVRRQAGKIIAFVIRPQYARAVSSVGSVRKASLPPPDAQVQVVGAEVGGYVLGELLTQGGMASVYLGKRVAPGGFEKAVVFKRLRPELASQPALLALFLREASLSAGLEHPSIVRTLDLAKLDGSYYLVMEYVRGGDLRLLLRRARRRGQRFSAAAALRIGRELLTALEYAHSRCTADGWPLGLSHRDVSPANILLSAEGEVKLSDFGIAQASSEEGLGDFAGVRLRGKVGYMSPEQACGAPVDGRSDLFALAVVLYEVLTGKRLFIGQPGQPLTEIYQAAIVPPSQLCPELPAAADAVLAKALCIDKEGRYQSAREFYDALLTLTRQHDLWLDHVGFAEQLREVCGPDASSWRVLDERTGTAIIPSLESDYGSEDDSGVEDSRDYSRELTATAARAPLSSPDETFVGSEDPHQDTAMAGEGQPRSDGGPRSASGRLAPVGEPLSDHETVPWPTVPDKELLPPLGLSPDYTVPLPASALVAVDEPLPPRLPVSAAPAKDPGASSGSAFAPVRSAARPAIRVIEHAPPAIDLDAVTSPAELVETTAPLTKASLTPPAEVTRATLAPPAEFTQATLAPPNAFTQATLASPDEFTQATLAPLNAFTQATLAPPNEFTQATLAPPAEFTQATLAPSNEFTQATLAPLGALGEETPPALNISQGALLPVPAVTTHPMPRMTWLRRLRESARPLFTRAGGGPGLTLWLLVLAGLGFTLWLVGAQAWSWVAARLQAP